MHSCLPEKAWGGKLVLGHANSQIEKEGMVIKMVKMDTEGFRFWVENIMETEDSDY